MIFLHAICSQAWTFWSDKMNYRTQRNILKKRDIQVDIHKYSLFSFVNVGWHSISWSPVRRCVNHQWLNLLGNLPFSWFVRYIYQWWETTKGQGEGNSSAEAKAILQVGFSYPRKVHPTSYGLIYAPLKEVSEWSKTLLLVFSKCFRAGYFTFSQLKFKVNKGINIWNLCFKIKTKTYLVFISVVTIHSVRHC